MDSTTRRYTWVFFLVLISVMVAAYLLNIFATPQTKPRLSPAPTNESSYVTIRDTSGRVILETGLPVAAKDEYINEKNINYVIISVKGRNAVARIKEPGHPVSPSQSERSIGASSAVPAQAAPFNTHVVIYHSHSDESFGYGTGITSKPGDGQIYQVGSALTQSLEKSGVSVTHSFNTHGPHDINAYYRSRRTALQLLKERPDAIFDIHRDSAPAEAYFDTVNGINTARVMIVVGRSNPSEQTNLDFAQRVKDMGDALYPGMMRGIFIGQGDYNQDLYPTALIFEIGTDTMSVDLAENAATCLGDVITHTIAR
ncbi:MAG: stage II sporulation protein P [Deltaproteobacteria bacterium]